MMKLPLTYPEPRRSRGRYVRVLRLAGFVLLGLLAVHIIFCILQKCEEHSYTRMMWSSYPFAALASLTGLVSIAASASINDCPGYTVTAVRRQSTTGLQADLKLAGPACNIYGTDLPLLTLDVTYESASRTHVKIYDPAEQVYQISEDVFPRPGGTSDVSDLDFTYTESPFSFAIVRKSNNETLFNTAGSSIVFESQYLRLRTSLPDSPNLYGIGEHADPFRLETKNYVRTLWNQDAPGVPANTNLYGSHPVYFDHRADKGTHGVFLLNSNGMDIKIDQDAAGGQYLEYNTLGGIFDFYFMSGPSPLEVSKQYADIAGRPAMMPYFGLGFHQCKYGYRDILEVAAVVANYSQANIPLEVMWTDIDYMDRRRVFSLDSARYPLSKMRELISYLHDHHQHYVLMVDPAVWHGDYDAYNNGVKADALLKVANDSVYTGVVWPGPASFPDWFHPNTQAYWNNEFLQFFDKDNGVDVDALWIDMNEAANFCPFPCEDPFGYAASSGNPPIPPPPRPDAGYSIPGFPSDFQPAKAVQTSHKRQSAFNKGGLSGRDLINPAYQIRAGAGSISNKTITTDIQNYDGTYQYDTHNLYGTMMSVVSRNSMVNRRPGKRPLVITRSTFAGAGRSVGHWLGDNLATWDAYKTSISQIIEFSALYQIPMVGADVCGFGYDTTVNLCQRWATLGAFYPFFRNHAADFAKPHEFYRWPEVADTAREAINRRMSLLDYLYTAFYQNNANGTPVLSPLFFKYPEDSNTFGIGYQFFFGDALLISPVTDGDTTKVTYYLPKDIWYDFFTNKMIAGNGTQVTEDVPFSSVPIHIRGGEIIPMRMGISNTTTELRNKPFGLLIAAGADGTASGQLYLDDGESIDPANYQLLRYTYSKGLFSMSGQFGYDTSNITIARITVLDSADNLSQRTKQQTAQISDPVCDYSIPRCVFETYIGLDKEFQGRLFDYSQRTEQDDQP